MDLDLQGPDSPFIQGKTRGLHHDSISSLGFLVCTSVGEIGNWKVRGGTRDSDEAIFKFALFNSPLSKRADEWQTIELVMEIIYNLLPVVVADTGR